jgi:hypothetical protein
VTIKKFSKDPKSHLVSIKQFLSDSDFLSYGKNDVWDESQKHTRPKYYEITGSLLIFISFYQSFNFFACDFTDKLDRIEIAFRDGKTEFELFDAEIDRIKEAISHHKYSQTLVSDLAKIKRNRKHLCPYAEPSASKTEAPFESHVIKCSFDPASKVLAEKYVVLDVETNGLRKKNDDLLSLSIYDPLTGDTYNRYFPLDLQPVVLTGFIHGIKESDLKSAMHLTQGEFNWIVSKFRLADRTILTYSGGKGTFDSDFLNEYCLRHGIVGQEKLKYQNIKSIFPQTPFGCEGQMTKDNLCQILGIAGVNEIHSSLNDCLLEWKLFEKIESGKFFFIENNLYEYNSQYIIPVTYGEKHPELLRFAGIDLPYFNAVPTVVYRQDLSKKAIREVKKFPTNITGMAIENGIDFMVGADKQDNYHFLSENRSKIKYVGSLNSSLTEVPVNLEADGTITAINHDDQELVSEVNHSTGVFMKEVASVADFIKIHIFDNEKIKNQEMVITEDRKMLALCDLSSSTSVLEIKTFDVLEGTSVSDKVAKQLFVQSNGRKTFLMSVYFEKHLNRKYEWIVDGIKLTIYGVSLVRAEKPEEPFCVHSFYGNKLLALLKEDGHLTQKEMSEKMPCSCGYIEKTLPLLAKNGYIARLGEGRSAYWIVKKNHIPD